MTSHLCVCSETMWHFECKERALNRSANFRDITLRTSQKSYSLKSRKTWWGLRTAHCALSFSFVICWVGRCTVEVQNAILSDVHVSRVVCLLVSVPLPRILPSSSPCLPTMPIMPSTHYASREIKKTLVLFRRHWKRCVLFMSSSDILHCDPPLLLLLL